MSRRAFCVSLDGAACSLVEAALAGAGLTVEHTTAVPPDVAGATVVVVDGSVRRAAGDALRALAAPVVVVGDDVDDDGLIALMDEAPVSHLVGDPRDRDLGITSEKLASGDLFGLEKYIAAGTPVAQRVVTCDLDKRRAMDEVGAWAESAGARRAVLHRIANVVDELLMNALHDGRAVVRWAADDRTLALSVGDARGALRQCDVIDHVRRAKHERGRPQPPSDGGAGIGLYLVLANVAALVVNIERGRRTEVVCLFDHGSAPLRGAARPTEGGACGRGARPARVRSLHVFVGRAS